MSESQTLPALTPAGVDCWPFSFLASTAQETNVYSGTVSGGTQQTTNPEVFIPALLTSEYFLAKFDGPNAGYVLFNTADFLAAGNTSIPANGSSIWISKGSGLSHYTFFGTTSVPDGGTTLLLLGAALGGLGIVRRRMNV